MIYLIIGRIASGRHYLADILKNNLPANEKDNELVLNAVHDSDTVVQNNVIITAPDRFRKIAAADPGEMFILIHVEAEDIDRRIKYVHSAEKKIKADEAFDAANSAENALYDDFDIFMHDLMHANGNIDDFPANITRCCHYVNDYSPETAIIHADNIVKDNMLNKEVAAIVTELHSKGLIQGKTNSERLSVTTSTDTKLVNASYFAELILTDDSVFADTMKIWLVTKNGNLTANDSVINHTGNTGT